MTVGVSANMNYSPKEKKVSSMPQRVELVLKSLGQTTGRGGELLLMAAE